jgi:hypothetical protein
MIQICMEYSSYCKQKCSCCSSSSSSSSSSGPCSSVAIATDYGLDGPGFESQWGRDFFAHIQTGPEAHPASCAIGTGSFPGVKRAGCGADHPPRLAPRSRKSRAIPVPTL